jgi:protocatechuate 3,4-dioxygenase beta subunit
MLAIDPALASRRRFLRNIGVGAAAITASHFLIPGAFAEELVRTPAQTEGPFYPDHLPLDTDNELIVINDAITPAVGDNSSPVNTRQSGEPLRSYARRNLAGGWKRRLSSQRHHQQR